jgi:hypothetical protein
VTVWTREGTNSSSITSQVVVNTGFFVATNLDNHKNYWFWVSNDCSTTPKIDPLP